MNCQNTTGTPQLRLDAVEVRARRRKDRCLSSVAPPRKQVEMLVLRTSIAFLKLDRLRLRGPYAPATATSCVWPSVARGDTSWVAISRKLTPLPYGNIIFNLSRLKKPSKH